MKMKKTNKIGSVVKSNNSVIAKLPKYNNVDIEKLQILQDNAAKSGIYLFTNLVNGKRYIGSSQNLRKRFLTYLNTKYLLRTTSMNICKAFLKYGYSNFSLTILEYCEPEKCLEREKHYWGLLNPEYNIAKEPDAPFSGRSHSDESKTKISDALAGKKNPMFGKNHSENTKTIMSEAKTGENNPMYGKNHSGESRQIMSDAKKGKGRAEGAGKPSQVIEVTDITKNTTTSYNSISEAGRALNINESSIRRNLKSNSNKP